VPFHVVFLWGNDVLSIAQQGEILSDAKAYALTHYPIQRARHQATRGCCQSKANSSLHDGARSLRAGV
jgi:hypothetical protein